MSSDSHFNKTQHFFISMRDFFIVFNYCLRIFFNGISYLPLPQRPPTFPYTADLVPLCVPTYQLVLPIDSQCVFHQASS
uniref:Uncharacterized protein n=1 Tax=Mus musculus TaxID=10090 RepID=Q3UPL2_MOUSE|nr:unnamed protein product [Mus musculus]